jgi:hypothetical protein
MRAVGPGRYLVAGLEMTALAAASISRVGRASSSFECQVELVVVVTTLRDPKTETETETALGHAAPGATSVNGLHGFAECRRPTV